MIILKSKLGRFEFPDGTLMCQAQLIRDTVMGQWFNPQRGAKKLDSLNSVYEFMANHPSAVIACLDFELVLEPQYGPKKLKEEENYKMAVGDNKILDEMFSVNRIAAFLRGEAPLGALVGGHSLIGHHGTTP